VPSSAASLIGAAQSTNPNFVLLFWKSTSQYTTQLFSFDISRVHKTKTWYNNSGAPARTAASKTAQGAPDLFLGLLWCYW
jgi:hypothetical protein